MFCPSNDTIQNITEKTKLLAQKCSQQIRVSNINSAQNSSPSKKDGSTNGSARGKKLLCPCKATLSRIITKRTSPSRERTTKWYIKQPTWRFFNEEHEPDAIYTVYLKKVRYHRPTPSASSDSDDDISHLEWETVRVRFVKAATISRLVEALASDDGELESSFVNVFLTTYRAFADPEKVLHLLLQRYENLHLENFQTETIAEQHKKTLVSVLHVWMDGYPEDWDLDNLQRIFAFTSKRLPNSDLHRKVLFRLDQYKRKPSKKLWSDDYCDQYRNLCLTQVFREPPPHYTNLYRFPDIDVKHFAEQLTRMDMQLFRRVIPHQCIGSIWSKRDKYDCSSVVATIEQFNAVLYRVISTILIEPSLKPSDRALLISTWIDIAQELRLLKNFSSLKAIISGLQSNAIYRLEKTWAVLPKEKLELYRELERIFSGDDNLSAQREVLMREGTAKFADTVGVNDKHLKVVFQKQNTSISHGTIPFVGIFLTDLNMINEAHPDTLGDGLINFDKRRKEFELLAQIKLLQGAANTYHLSKDPIFDRWFASLLVLDETKAHTLSCKLEPDEPAKKHKKSDSNVSNSSSGAGFKIFIDTSSHNSRNNSLDRDATPLNTSILSTASSTSSLSMESTTSSSQKSHHNSTSSNNNSSMNNHHNNNSSSSNNKNSHNDNVPIINAQLKQNSQTKNNGATPDFYIIKVTYETDNVELDGIILYKSIMLGNNEHTPQVIRNAMMKLGLEGDPDKFTISQVLPDNEFLIPQNANVYYAINTQFNLNFILRPKKNIS